MLTSAADTIADKQRADEVNQTLRRTTDTEETVAQPEDREHTAETGAGAERSEAAVL